MESVLFAIASSVAIGSRLLIANHAGVVDVVRDGVVEWRSVSLAFRIASDDRRGIS
jgi:hypothetical protein